MTKHYIIATAGHVDHGKSALVQALTGVNPDRLPEERARGMTIDLGFARLALDAPGTTPGTLNLGVIDVPGHENLVKNMVAGLAAVDLALLAVAADDGWMPQTEEHLQILAYLRIPRLVVALTKADLAGPRLAGVVEAIRRELRNSPYSNAEIVPTSVLSGSGLDRLKLALCAALEDADPARDIGKPRLPIDRVFTLRGVGTIVTGTLTGGCLARGQEVVIQPGGELARIRSVQSHNHEVERGEPGMRVALNLVGAFATSLKERSTSLRRGGVVTLPELGKASSAMDVWVERSPRFTRASGRPELKHSGWVSVHLGTGVTEARIFFPNRSALPRAGSSVAQLRFAAPVFVFGSDRFVLRDSSGQSTVGGGVVLDPQATTEAFRSSSQQQYLREREAVGRSASAAVAALVRRDGAVTAHDLLRQSSFSAAEIDQAVDALLAAKRVVTTNDLLIGTEVREQLLGQVGEILRAHHQEHPAEPGMSTANLASFLRKAEKVPAAVLPALGNLLSEHFVVSHGLIRHKTHVPTLPPGLQAEAARIRRILQLVGVEPPGCKEFASDDAAQQALQFLVLSGEVVQLSPELVLSRASFEGAKQVVIEAIRQHGPRSVGEIRDALGASRRIVVPLLEHLDREGVTVRRLDRRVLKMWPPT